MYMNGINSGIIDANDLNDLNKMRDTMGFDPVESIIEKPMSPLDEENGIMEGPAIEA
jgi:aldehyde:ferredoxin oxidoreductase